MSFLPKKKIEETLRRTFIGEKVAVAVIRVIYLGDSDIRKMNKEYLNHDYATDVITFSLGEKDTEGEIYIGVETAKRQAAEYKVSLTNELMRLAAHGALHLCGYTDNTGNGRKKMHELENKYINEPAGKK